MEPDRYVDHYLLGKERDRLSRGAGLLERERTRALIRRHVRPPARVLDVGGAAGVHARWLADEGFDVTLVDPVPLHLEQARAEADSGAPFAVRAGDARDLPERDASNDAVLLLGPLYHLVERADRLIALHEARRVLRPGGFVFAAAISRFSPMLDGLFKGMFEQPGFVDVVERGLVTGHHDPPPDRWFTLAYLHRPDELRTELADAGLSDVRVIGVEGPGCLLPDLDRRYSDPAAWELVMRTAEWVEAEPNLLGISSHLMAIGRAT